jgi:hypothetical protein
MSSDEQQIIKFNQSDVISTLGYNTKLRQINLQFDGLCEIICNYVLVNDLLGEQGASLRANYVGGKRKHRAHAL